MNKAGQKPKRLNSKPNLFSPTNNPNNANNLHNKNNTPSPKRQSKLNNPKGQLYNKKGDGKEQIENLSK